MGRESDFNKAVSRVSQFVIVVLLALFSLWWGVTAVGGAAWVAVSVADLWKSAVFVWIELYGWQKAYALGGAVTTMGLTALFGPAVLREFLWLSSRSPIEALIAVLIGGSSLLLLIPLVFAGWPFVVWLACMDRVRKT